eukprot:IDg760t1
MPSTGTYRCSVIQISQSANSFNDSNCDTNCLWLDAFNAKMEEQDSVGLSRNNLSKIAEWETNRSQRKYNSSSVSVSCSLACATIL